MAQQHVRAAGMPTAQPHWILPVRRTGARQLKGVMTDRRSAQPPSHANHLGAAWTRSPKAFFMEVPWCGPHVCRWYCRLNPLVTAHPASATARRPHSNTGSEGSRGLFIQQAGCTRHQGPCAKCSNVHSCIHCRRAHQASAHGRWLRCVTPSRASLVARSSAAPAASARQSAAHLTQHPAAAGTALGRCQATPAPDSRSP